MVRYYADTYALVEILKGNPAYERYATEELTTGEFSMLELAYALTRDYGEEKAVGILKIVRSFITIVQPRDEDYEYYQLLGQRLLSASPRGRRS